MIYGQHFLIRQDTKSVGCLYLLLLSNYEGLDLNLSKRRQVLADSGTESNPRHLRNYYKSSRGRRKKNKVFRGTPKKKD